MRGKGWLIVLLLLAGAIAVLGGLVWWHFMANRAGENSPGVRVVASRLEIPWSLAFLSDGVILFTERPGRVRLIDSEGNLRPAPLLTLPDVAAQGEGGLLGIALHPDFAQNSFVYLYYTYLDAGNLKNKVVRYTLQGLSLGGATSIIDGIPGAGNHDGGRIKFGPDRLLYITTGDAAQSQLAQDKNSLAGKILRLNPDGSIPADNPFPGSPVYSYGHRNPEGLSWDGQGRLWATEHGSSATDEINLVQAGLNYGWPLIRGDESVPGMQSPVIHSDSVTWAPSGAAVLDGWLYFTGLRGQSLYRLNINNPSVLERYFNQQYGRLRDVVVGPDGRLYLLTSNRDGRGIPIAEDDQVLSVDPAALTP